jgi:DNA-binding HxlR family transcriptional regulator
MAVKRSYDDGCANAHALDLIGERWALLVLRELMLGPKRFTDIRAGLPGISPNVLTQRLDELEEASLVVRRKLPPPASVWVYDLTEWGRGLEPVMQAIGRWAARSPHMRPGLPMSVSSVVLSLRTMFSPAAAKGLKGTIEIRLREQAFAATLRDGRMELVAGAATSPDAVVEADPDSLAGVIYGGRKLAEAMAAGDVRVEGDKALVKRFVTLFPLPERAPTSAA